MKQSIRDGDSSSIDALKQLSESWSQDFFSNFAQGSTFWEKLENGIQNGNLLSSNIGFDVSVDPSIMAEYEKVTQ